MLLDDIKAYLAGKGLVDGATGWPCYIGFMPDDSDKCVSLFSSGGYPPDTHGRENELLTFQSRVRGVRWEFTDAHAKWKAVFDALQDAQAGSLAGASPDPLEGYTFIQAMQMGPLHFNDSNGRPNLTSNWRINRAKE